MNVRSLYFSSPSFFPHSTFKHTICELSHRDDNAIGAIEENLQNENYMIVNKEEGKCIFKVELCENIFLLQLQSMLLPTILEVSL